MIICCLLVEYEISCRLTRRVPLVEQELVTFRNIRVLLPICSGVLVVRSLVFCVVFCRLVYYLSFLDLRILIKPFVSSNGSCRIFKKYQFYEPKNSRGHGNADKQRGLIFSSSGP